MPGRGEAANWSTNGTLRTPKTIRQWQCSMLLRHADEPMVNAYQAVDIGIRAASAQPLRGPAWRYRDLEPPTSPFLPLDGRGEPACSCWGWITSAVAMHNSNFEKSSRCSSSRASEAKGQQSQRRSGLKPRTTHSTKTTRDVARRAVFVVGDGAIRPARSSNSTPDEIDSDGRCSPAQLLRRDRLHAVSIDDC